MTLTPSGSPGHGRSKSGHQSFQLTPGSRVFRRTKGTEVSSKAAPQAHPCSAGDRPDFSAAMPPSWRSGRPPHVTGLRAEAPQREESMTTENNSGQAPRSPAGRRQAPAPGFSAKLFGFLQLFGFQTHEGALRVIHGWFPFGRHMQLHTVVDKGLARVCRHMPLV